MKQKKEIIKSAISLLFVYAGFCIFGIIATYHQGTDVKMIYTGRLAVGVFVFITLSTIISLFKQEYDSCRFNGYNCLCISLAFMFQIVIYANIFGKYKIIVCMISYIASFLLGIFIILFVTEKIFVKNRTIRETISAIGVILGACILFITSIGKLYTGRRGSILLNRLGINDQNDNLFIWIVLLVCCCIFAMCSSINLASVAVRKSK